MTAGPIIMRTAFRSLVARDIRSPVRCAWKYDSGSFCRCAKKSFRMSYSMWRDAPIRIRRIRNRNTPADHADAASSAAPYKASFPRVTPRVRSSIGELQDPGRGERDAGGDDDAGKPEEEVAPIAAGRSRADAGKGTPNRV